MERRKPSRSRKGSATEDDLALVKAAAWAWYERGSGSETRAIREFDHLSAMPRRRDLKPTRYKLEAMKNSSREKPQKVPTPPLSPVSSYNDSEISVSNSLLDDYEIERISKQLGLYIESSRAEYSRSSSTVLGSDRSTRSSNRVASLSESGTTDKRSKPKKKNSSSRGFWPFKYTAICGSRTEDVVDGRSFKVITSRRQLPEKDTTVGRSTSYFQRAR